jgi:surface protein
MGGGKKKIPFKTKVLTAFAGICLLFLFAFNANAQSATDFVTIWNTNGGTSIKIGAAGDYTVSWKGLDPGNSSVSGTNPNASNVYTIGVQAPSTPLIAGNYEVRIAPRATSTPFNQMDCGSNLSAIFAAELKQITQWGNISWISFANAYQGCINLTITATDIPNTAAVIDMRFAFADCSSLTTVPNMNFWNTSNVTNMTSTFEGATNFNENIGGWNTSKVKNIDKMFFHAMRFNQNISNWDVRAIQTANDMFGGNSMTDRSDFNQNLGKWYFQNLAQGNKMFQYSSMSCKNYTLTLNGWSLKTYVLRPQFGSQTGMVYADGSFGRTILSTSVGSNINTPDGIFPSRGWNPVSGDVAASTIVLPDARYPNVTAQDLTDCAAAPLILPVTFGNISAIIKDGQLQLSWSTLTETNVDHFEIQASKDGNNFVKIGEIKTKADGGNSTAALNYSFSKEVVGISGLLGISMFALAIGFMKRKKLSYLFIAGGLLFLFAGAACNKKETSLETNKDSKIFIRIKQIDTNSDFQYSKIVQAVNN